MNFSKHSGVMAYFQKNYVKSGIFEKEYSKILTEVFEIRSESDDYYIISKEEVEKQIQNAQLHTNLIAKFKFSFCRIMQKSIHESDPEYLDGKYWAEQGWLDSGRPWK